MGLHAPYLEQVKLQANEMKCHINILVNVSDVCSLMVNADLAIGAAGGTAWERCCLGVPSLILVLACNQKEGAAALDDFGAAIVLRDVSGLSDILENKLLCRDNRNILKRMSAAAAELTDGMGTSRVLEYLV
jgi:spore coat polysaccharide biosynthesis predicted glycosyltransferase SpsG